MMLIITTIIISIIIIIVFDIVVVDRCVSTCCVHIAVTLTHIVLICYFVVLEL